MLVEPKRARKYAQKRSLNPEQQKQIKKMIVDHYLEKLKLPFAFLDRQAIQLLILQQLGVNILIRTVGHYLLRCGYIRKRPIRTVYEQRYAAVLSVCQGERKG